MVKPVEPNLVIFGELSTQMCQRLFVMVYFYQINYFELTLNLKFRAKTSVCKRITYYGAPMPCTAGSSSKDHMNKSF